MLNMSIGEYLKARDAVIKALNYNNKGRDAMWFKTAIADLETTLVNNTVNAPISEAIVDVINSVEYDVGVTKDEAMSVKSLVNALGAMIMNRPSSNEDFERDMNAAEKHSNFNTDDLDSDIMRKSSLDYKVHSMVDYSRGYISNMINPLLNNKIMVDILSSTTMNNVDSNAREICSIYNRLTGEDITPNDIFM